MNEEQFKLMCKQIVDNSNRQLSEMDKELLKQAIDQSKKLGRTDNSSLSIKNDLKIMMIFEKLLIECMFAVDANKNLHRMIESMPHFQG